MSDAKERLLREKGFGFFGAITASLSHEINNVLAIINELSGLLDDFFQAAEQGASLNVERLKGTTQRIAAQVERGETYVKRLNRFAHTVDSQRALIDVNDTVEAITTLCRRFATLRRVEIQTRFPETSPCLEGSPFEIEHIVFRCIQIVLNSSHQGDTIHIEVETQADGVRLSFVSGSAVGSPQEIEAERDFLAVLVGDRQGELELEIRSGHPARLLVSLPHSLGSVAAGEVDQQQT